MPQQASCLCGGVAWDVDGPLQFVTHCHCARCRKAHGAAFSTAGMVPAGALRFTRGRELVRRFASSPSLQRLFCGTCGSVVPDDESLWQGNVFVHPGCFDGAPEVQPVGHIFAASKAPWFAIADGLPTFDAYPPGVDAPVLADLPAPTPPAGGVRGSCLCGDVAFVVDGAPVRAYHCHCSRCRKGRAAAFATNMFTAHDGVRMIRGEDRLASYKVPDARYFKSVFCRRCGSKMPRFDAERGIVVIPMGALDDDPGIRPMRNIFVGSKAPWSVISDGLPQDEAAPAG